MVRLNKKMPFEASCGAYGGLVVRIYYVRVM